MSDVVSRTRQEAGRPRLRVVLPRRLEESLAVAAAARLQNAAAAAQVDLTWHDGAITLAELSGLPVIHGRAAPSP